jgi:glycosyltransferase involved in cell wall biosynthesis
VPPRPKLSIVVPFFNEEESIRPLHAAIVAAVEPAEREFEMIFVDDGSRDRTFEVAVELARADSRVRVVKFRRNYGQTPAMAAGIQEARGDVIVTMDGDLQNDPADIPRLVATIEQGHDIVVGWRHERQDKLITRKVPSRIANALIARATGVPIHDNGCSLKAYRATLIKRIPLYSEMHRFIPAVSFIAGPRIAELKVRHHARQFGRSKYGLSRVYKVLLDLMVIKTVASFTSRPLVWFGMLSVPLLAAAAALIGYALVQLGGGGARLDLAVAGSGVIFLTSALILLSAGAIAELVYKVGDMREIEFSSLTQRTRSRVVPINSSGGH